MVHGNDENRWHMPHIPIKLKKLRFGFTVSVLQEAPNQFDSQYAHFFALTCQQIQQSSISSNLKHKHSQPGWVGRGCGARKQRERETCSGDSEGGVMNNNCEKEEQQRSMVYIRLPRRSRTAFRV